MKKLAIIGSGDLGQLVAHHAKACGYSVAGFFDDYQEKDKLIDSYSVIGKLSDIEKTFSEKKFDALFVAIGYNHFEFRKNIFEKYYGKIPYALLIHPSCYVDPSCQIGEGVFILPGCTLDRNVALGNNVLLNTGVTIAHDTSIGNHSFISPAVQLAGFIKIGSCCMIGIGTTVIDNIKIIDKVRTAAGAVIIKNLEEVGLYGGVPARKIK